MFKLKLPLRDDDGDGPSRSPILSEDAQEVESHNSSQSLFDFDEDGGSDAGADHNDPEDEDAEEIDLETMEAVFDNDTRQMIVEYEQELNLLDEEWLLANVQADPEQIASELTDREIKKQKKLYNLRRQKFYELGGRKKTRNIMMRYGITHLKLLKEQHTDGGGGDYSAVETHPRSVSNSILLHLKYGVDLVRIEWLKAVFRMLAKKQRSEALDAKRFDVLPPAVVVPTKASSSATLAPTSSSSPFKRSDTLDAKRFDALPRRQDGDDGSAVFGDGSASPPHQAPMTRTSSLSWMDVNDAGFSMRIPDVDSVAADTPTNATATASPTGTAATEDDANKAYMQRRKAAGGGAPSAADPSAPAYSDPPKRIPSNGVDENNFARGMLCFFELLARHDRRRRLVDRELHRLQRQEAGGASSPGVAEFALEDAAEAAKSELFDAFTTACGPDMNFELPPDDTSDLDKSAVMSRAASFVIGSSSTTSMVLSRRLSIAAAAPTAQESSGQVAGGSDDDEDDHDGPADAGGDNGGANSPNSGRKKFVGRDFLARSPDIIDAGFRFLFCAVDANDNGFITWDALLEYLLDATLLTKAADQAMTSRDYEFVRHHHTTSFTELNDVCLVPARSMFVIGGIHATIVSNRVTSSSTSSQQPGEDAAHHHGAAVKKVASMFPERNCILSPIDPLTLVPHYKVTALCHMASLKMLAIVGSDSTVRIYTLHSVAHPRMIASARFDSNARTVVWFKDLLFVGTRQGTLYSFGMSHSKSGGWQLRLHKQAHSHSGEEGISRIVCIPMESCVCTASYDRSMVLHDAKSLTVVHRFSKEHTQGITDMCYCSCINGLATVSFDHKIMIWMVSLLHNKPIVLSDSVRDHVGTLMSVACVEHSQSLVTLDTKGMVKIWGLRNFLCIQTISAASFVPVQDVGAHFFKVIVYHSAPSVVLPLGSTQLHLFSRRRLFVFEYNLSQRHVVLRNTADDEGIVYVGYNYIEQLYITFSITSVRIWEAATCVIRDTFRCPTVEEHGGISSAFLHPNGRAYYIGTHRGTIVAKNFSTGTTMFLARCHRGPSVALRFCYAATVAARVAATSATASTKAGLGDIIVSIADDSCFVLTSDFRTLLTLDGAENPRCLDHDPQSSLILVGDAAGAINVYLQANISNQKNLPFQVLQLPTKIPREITALTMFHGLSTFAAIDDEGTMGLFSLKHHPRPFTCVGVWSHVAETSGGGCPSVGAMAFHHTKWLLYCGDELGVVTVYNVREAFLQSQQTNASAAALLMNTSDNATFILEGSMLLGGGAMSPKGSSRAAVAARRAAASGKSPRTFAKSPRVGTTPRTPNALGASPTFVSPGALMSPTSPRKAPGRMGGPQFPADGLAVGGNHNTSEPLDFRVIGGTVTVVNRFSAHHDGITHLVVISPDNSNMGEGALTLDDPVVGHTVLLTTSADQCCCSWKLCGTSHLGSLEQYGRCRVPITSAIAADDTHVIATQRDMHQLDARRDFIKLRSRGLVRLANTRIISIIPQRMLPTPVIQIGQGQASQNGLLLSARSNSGGFPGGGASGSTSVTPRSARLSRLMAQIAPTAANNNGVPQTIHPDVPLRSLWGVQEYNRLALKRRKSVKQLNESNAAGTLAITKAQIDTLGAGATANKPPQDADTLSQMLASEDGANSVLDELFSLHSGSLHNQPALSRHASTLFSGSVRSHSQGAASSVAGSIAVSHGKFKNLANALLHNFTPSSEAINAASNTRLLSRRVARQQEARDSSKALSATTESLAHQAAERREQSTAATRAATAKLRRTSSVVSDWEASAMVNDSMTSSTATTVLTVNNGGLARPGDGRRARRSTTTNTLVRRDDGPDDCNSILSGSITSQSFPFHKKRPLSASTSSTTVSRRPVKIVSMYVVPTKTLRQEPKGTKDKRLGYHCGTLEAYRVQQQTNPTTIKFVNPAQSVERSDGIDALTSTTGASSPCGQSVPLIATSAVDDDTSSIDESENTGAASNGLPMQKPGLSPVSNESVWSSPITPESRALLRNSPEFNPLLEADLQSALVLLDETGLFASPPPDAISSINEHPAEGKPSVRNILWTREALEGILPNTPMRDRIIRILIEYGQTTRRDLVVDALTERKSQQHATYKQMVFSNKQIKDIVHDPLALYDVPLQQEVAVAALNRSVAQKSKSGRQSPSRQAKESFIIAGPISSGDSLVYRTTMTPPPPEIFNMRRPRSSQTYQPPQSSSQIEGSGGCRPATASVGKKATLIRASSHDRGSDVHFRSGHPVELISQIATSTLPNTRQWNSPSAKLFDNVIHAVVPTSGSIAEDIAEWHVDAPSATSQRTAATALRSHQHSRGKSFDSVATTQEMQERRSLFRAMDTLALVDKRDAVNCAASVQMPTLKPSKTKRGASAGLTNARQRIV